MVLVLVTHSCLTLLCPTECAFCCGKCVSVLPIFLYTRSIFVFFLFPFPPPPPPNSFLSMPVFLYSKLQWGSQSLSLLLCSLLHFAFNLFPILVSYFPFPCIHFQPFPLIFPVLFIGFTCSFLSLFPCLFFITSFVLVSLLFSWTSCGTLVFLIYYQLHRSLSFWQCLSFLGSFSSLLSCCTLNLSSFLPITPWFPPAHFLPSLFHSFTFPSLSFFPHTLSLLCSVCIVPVVSCVCPVLRIVCVLFNSDGDTGREEVTSVYVPSLAFCLSLSLYLLHAFPCSLSHFVCLRSLRLSLCLDVTLSSFFQAILFSLCIFYPLLYLSLSITFSCPLMQPCIPVCMCVCERARKCLCVCLYLIAVFLVLWTWGAFAVS